MLTATRSVDPWQIEDLDFDFGVGARVDEEDPESLADGLPVIELDPVVDDSANPDLSEGPGIDAFRLDGRLVRARELLPDGSPGAFEESPDLFPTQLGEADLLLAGGIARGEMVEILGRRTSGRFSLVLSTLTAATRRGDSVALVDLGDHLDPQSAQDCGAELERLLWLRPRHMKEALGCAELLLQAGFDLVALDLGMPPVPGGRGAESAWLRLGRAAQAHRGALLVSAPYRMSGTAAQAVLELCPRAASGSSPSRRFPFEDRRARRPEARWLGEAIQRAGRSTRLLRALASELRLRKSRSLRLRADAREHGRDRARVLLRVHTAAIALSPLVAAEQTRSEEKARTSEPTTPTRPRRERIEPRRNPNGGRDFALPEIQQYRERHPDSSSWSEHAEDRRRVQPGWAEPKRRHAG